MYPSLGFWFVTFSLFFMIFNIFFSAVQNVRALFLLVNKSRDE